MTSLGESHLPRYPWKFPRLLPSEFQYVQWDESASFVFMAAAARYATREFRHVAECSSISFNLETNKP